jgi:SAM-dependent methyltransferase
MGNEFKGQAGHSAEHFGDSRDHWWNVDFLRLMAKRWRFDEVRHALDVGCGVGHWGMLLAQVLPSDARVTGVDRDPSWVETASARAAARGLGDRFSYRVGEAQRLPFADDTFDLTTCQTVLIHLADPAAAIDEMVRVTKPGGLVAVAEPNNLSEAMLLDSIAARAGVDDVVELLRFQLTCERGKVALGEGDNSLGDRVPGLFAARGLGGIEVYTNDKAGAVFPPYAGALQRAFNDDLRDSVARERWHWDEDETRRLFVAGGGSAGDFSTHWRRALASRAALVKGIDDGTYHGVVGGLFYLVAGRKPASADV